jgi:hypothetical protein
MIIKDPVAPLLSSTLLLFSSCGVVGQDNEHCTAIDEKPPCHAQTLQREEVVSVPTMDHRRRMKKVSFRLSSRQGYTACLRSRILSFTPMDSTAAAISTLCLSTRAKSPRSALI